MRCYDWPLFVFRPVPVLAAAASLALSASSARATWSILIADTRTGEIVLGSATCVESIDLQLETPVLITGVGAVTAQSALDVSGMNRLLIRDRLLQGVPLGAILDELAMTDAGHANRQYGMITAGGDSLTYSGTQNADWAGGMTGRIERGRPGPDDDIVYSVQGNILSGANVVQAAVDALIASDTDLPGRLMAAMLAARSAGGDGRCSCSPANPTGCGSPPPAPFKSAHVSYMLGARFDDIDAARGVYPTPNDIGGVALADLDHDGMKDVVVGDAETGELLLFLNTSTPGDPLSTLRPGGSILAPAAATLAMHAGDFNADGLDDIALAHASPPTLTIYEGRPHGGPALAASFTLPGPPTGLAVGDLLGGGEQIALSIGSAHIVRFFGMDGGQYGALTDLLIPGDPGAIEIGNLPGGPAPGLAVALAGDDRVLLFEHLGSLGFDAPVAIDTADGPVALGIADMDLDGGDELLVQCGPARRVQVFRQQDDQWPLWGSATTTGAGIGFAAGAMNQGDEYPDLVTAAATTNRNLELLISDGQGGFTQQTRTRVGARVGALALSDMNGNGDLDIVVGGQRGYGLIVLDNPRTGILPQPDRFAEGEYFLELDVPNQREDDPDPVDQLQAMFDAWRAGLEGDIDAIRSRVLGPRRMAPGQAVTLTIELRDWRGEVLDLTDPALLSISADGAPVAVGGPAAVGPGVFEVAVTGVTPEEHGRLVVRAGQEGERVRLMPDVEVFVAEHAADLNADGVCNFFDVSLFLGAYLGGDPDADLDANGLIDFFDLSEYLRLLGLCRGG